LTDAELRGLLMDCLTLWAVQGRVSVGDANIGASPVSHASVTPRSSDTIMAGVSRSPPDATSQIPDNGLSQNNTRQDLVLEIDTMDGIFTVQRADPDLRPVRWFYQTPERRAAGRPPRATPSIVALLSALRNALGGQGGQALRVGH
jgi:hypothetical protein